MTMTDDAPLEPDIEPGSGSALAEAARGVAANPDVQEALQSVVDLAMASCECCGASVTLVRTTGGAETTATSGELIEQADNLQYKFDEGPCLRAARLSCHGAPGACHGPARLALRTAPATSACQYLDRAAYRCLRRHPRLPLVNGASLGTGAARALLPKAGRVWCPAGSRRLAG